MKLKTNQSGFSLIEMMVSVAIFSLVITIGGAAVLNQNATFKKTQHLREINDNLAFVMEEISRHLRLGSNYNCGSSLPIEEPNDCLSDAEITFEHVFGNPDNSNDQWVYRINNGQIQKSKNSGSNFPLDLTPVEVEIDPDLSGFSVFGSEPNNGFQPRVLIRLAGVINYKGQPTPFSLQTLFAILIFSSSLAALLVVSGGGINSTVFAKNQLVASFLAQEGIEMVRNIRDNNVLNGDGWGGFGVDVIDCVGGCAIDPVDLAISTNYDLQYDSTGFFRPSLTAGLFQRTITVYFPGGFSEAMVTSEVSWNHGSTPHKITFRENLFEVTW